MEIIKWQWNFAAGGRHSFVWPEVTGFLKPQRAYSLSEAAIVAYGQRSKGFLTYKFRLLSGQMVTISIPWRIMNNKLTICSHLVKQRRIFAVGGRHGSLCCWRHKVIDDAPFWCHVICEHSLIEGHLSFVKCRINLRILYVCTLYRDCGKW